MVKRRYTLQAIGCMFALEDFGTGSSSFGYLDKLTVNMIKVDASFIQTLH
jgi:EAL domain-containing protein (putative c-di-GMP-specific phosphodiesterase class I)